MKVRELLPIRRAIPTKNPKSKWSDHKPDLREDFNDHCGYCGSYDGFRHTYFEVDHFIPKVFFRPLGNISDTEYKNLVYSCKFCNNNKLSEWPSKSEKIFNKNGKGFVDPCDKRYENHLSRTDDGEIIGKTNLGKWMYDTFKFDIRVEGIKLLWKINQLRLLIENINDEIKQLDKTSSNYLFFSEKLSEYTLEYFLNHKELMNYYDNL